MKLLGVNSNEKTGATSHVSLQLSGIDIITWSTRCLKKFAFNLFLRSYMFNICIVSKHSSFLFSFSFSFYFLESRRCRRAGARTGDLGWPSVYQGEPKFEIKHKSRCLQKSKLVNWALPWRLLYVVELAKTLLMDFCIRWLIMVTDTELEQD